MSKQELSIQERLELREKVIKEAQRDGIFAGLTAGLTGAILGSSLMRFSRNKSAFCGILTGLLSGYFFTQAFEQSNLARVESTLLGKVRIDDHQQS